MSFFQMPSPLAARRLFLHRTGLTLSGAAVALLAGNDALATRAGGAGAQDVQILNTALGAELEAIAVRLLQRVELLVEDDVGGAAVAVDQGEAALRFGGERGANNRHHRRDTGSGGNRQIVSLAPGLRLVDGQGQPVTRRFASFDHFKS